MAKRVAIAATSIAASGAAFGVSVQLAGTKWRTDDTGVLCVGAFAWQQCVTAVKE